MQPHLSVSGALGLRAPHPPFLGQQFSTQCGILPSPGLPGRRRREIHAALCPCCHSPRVPHGGRASRELGYPWRCPGWVRTVAGASSCAGGGGLGGTRRCQGPFSSQSSPFLLSSSCPTALPGPRQGSWAWFSCKDWRQNPMGRRRLHSLPVSGCSVCPCVAGWIQRGWKCFPRGSRSCPSPLEGTSSSSARPGAAAHGNLGLQGWTKLRDAEAHRTHSLPQEAWEWHCLEHP